MAGVDRSDLLILALDPTMELLTSDPSSTVPDPIETFGPTFDFLRVTLSSMYTGSMIVESPALFGRRARPRVSIASLVSSIVSILPASNQPFTSMTLILAPFSIMYWKASVRKYSPWFFGCFSTQSMPSNSSFQFRT